MAGGRDSKPDVQRALDRKFHGWKIGMDTHIVTELVTEDCTSIEEMSVMVDHFKPVWHSVQPLAAGRLALNLFWVK